MTTLDTGTGKLLCDIDGGIATVTFNNPDKRNALSLEMRDAIPPLLRTLEADERVRVVVVTGAGDKAFVSGADISEFGERRTTPEARAAYDRSMADDSQAWAELTKPVIAMIRGYCIGGGLLVALEADIRIAADDAQFAVPAARLGLGYLYSGVEGLLALVGPSWTAEMLYSARRLDATEALHVGLVNRVVPVDQLRPQVTELARTIAANAPLTVAAAKVALREARRPDPAERDVARAQAMIEDCFRSQDYLEGQAAFGDKRPPRFTGR